MMDRREFLKASTAVATGIVVADLLDLDRLLWEPKRLWTGADFALRDQHSRIWTMQDSLSAGYRKATTRLYKTYTKHVREYSWVDDVPTVEGRSIIIPIDL